MHLLIPDYFISALSSSNLDKFLLSIGKQPAYVDLEVIFGSSVYDFLEIIESD